MDYGAILQEIREEVRPLIGSGNLPQSIPPLAEVPADRFGMALHTVDGVTATAGDAHERFSIQSVAKVFILTLAMKLEGDAIWNRVQREPSGDPFNSLVQLEHKNGIPRNPFINAGAIVLVDVIESATGNAAGAVAALIRSACSQEVTFDERVAEAERRHAHRNRAMAHFLKSFGNLNNDVDRVLDAYFRICSLSMSCAELAAACVFLANGGRPAGDGEPLATHRQVKRTNAVMLTCGVYDAAGDFAYRVGLPGKSGIAGGIVAILPGRFATAVWSPGLDDNGNSRAGTMALELLTTKSGESIF